MLRTWSYAWWKPIVGVLLGVVIFFIVQIVLTVFLVIGAAVEGGPGTLGDRVTAAGNLDTVTPWTMLYVNLGLASLTLVTWLVVRVVHGLRPRWLASVLPGVRWKFLFACVGLAAVALGASLVVGAFLPEDPNGTSGTAHAPTGQLLATAVVILLTTPLQAIGEEYGFRGYLMQAFGSFFRSRVVALLVTSLLFALAHGTQNFPLFFDRFAFGLMAGLVVILVGGLEAGHRAARAEQPARLRRRHRLQPARQHPDRLPRVVVAAAGDAWCRTASSSSSCCWSRAGWACATPPLHRRRPGADEQRVQGAVLPAPVRVPVRLSSIGGRESACVSLALGPHGRTPWGMG